MRHRELRASSEILRLGCWVGNMLAARLEMAVGYLCKGSGNLDAIKRGVLEQ